MKGQLKLVNNVIFAPVAKAEVGRVLKKSQMWQVNQKLGILFYF